MWRRDFDPPEGESGLWTEDVVVVTNLRNVYRLAYKHSDGRNGVFDGHWQRPSFFQPQERVVEWTPIPIAK